MEECGRRNEISGKEGCEGGGGQGPWEGRGDVKGREEQRQVAEENGVWAQLKDKREGQRRTAAYNRVLCPGPIPVHFCSLGTANQVWEDWRQSVGRLMSYNKYTGMPLKTKSSPTG